VPLAAIRRREEIRAMIMNDTVDHVRSSLIERAKNILGTLGRFPEGAFQTLFRICTASVFWTSGLTKIASWQTTIVLFRDEYKVPVLPPEIAAYLGTAVELSCSTLIFLGLASRLATLPLIGLTMVIEIFVYPEDWSEHLTWLSMLLFILTRGPGPISLDAVIRRYALKGRM
jgi:putative oxidoreductase